ncbi:DUF4179 domain-containing protein [Priestia megaterium]|nr:DUF4179 domain-containing protein [Priestia megaterium]
MNQFDLNKQLKEEKENEQMMSPLVRAKLDETYEAIRNMPNESSTNVHRLRRRKILSVTAAGLILGAGLFSSAFISPTMAETIKKVPLLGDVFLSLEDDLGLKYAGEKGFIKAVESENTFKDVTLNASEVVYDGTRAAFLVNVDGVNIKDGKVLAGNKSRKITDLVKDIFIEVNGKNQSVSYQPAGENYPNALILQIPEGMGGDLSSEESLPNEFAAKLKIAFEGVDHMFELNVPVQRTVSEIAHAQPVATKTTGKATFSVSEITATPITTHVAARYEEKGFKFSASRPLKVAVYDEKGKQLTQLESVGELDEDSYTLDINYVSNRELPKSLILKPYIDKNESRLAEGNEAMEELELKINLPKQK